MTETQMRQGKVGRAAPEAKETPICTDFSKFSAPVKAAFDAMSERELFVTDCGDLFAVYLAAFPPGTNPMLEHRTQHDCQCCKQFVRRLGGLVTLEGGKVRTVWGGLALPHPYAAVAAAMDAAVKASPIRTVFRTKERTAGVSHNYHPKTNERFDHFHGVVAAKHFALDPDTKRSEREAAYQVMRRGLTEVRPADLETVLELIDSNGLYRGEEHRPAVAGFLDLSRRYLEAGDSSRFVWEHLDDRNARFRNTVIGTLLTDLAEGKELDAAVKAFEVKVAPTNYKRTTAVITQRMVEQAVETMTRLGLHGALSRRYARLGDIRVPDVLFVDNESRSRMKDGIAALLAGSVKQATPDMTKATRVTAEEFVRDVLPGAKTLQLFLENRHSGNFVTLTTGDDPARLFRWDNPVAWAYDGDVADSVKQRVKAAGGKIDCLLRCSLSWYNTDDLDLHAVTPRGEPIFFGNKRGILDVDMNVRGESRNPVENLAFNTLEDGVYEVFVHQFTQRESKDTGFAIEVEIGGVLHQYSYSKIVRGNVPCFRLHVKGGALMRLETDLTGGSISQEKWGVKTESLVPVAVVCHSPNHWGENRVGARHTIFALKGCVAPGSVRGIFNEQLRSDLEPHRKVFEVLGSRTKCPPSAEQVSGVGFTAARGDSVTVVVDGKRAYTIGF